MDIAGRGEIILEKEALRVEDACCRFLKANVLDHFIFSVGEGEICCLFGLHNAGKTTFMQLMAGRAAGIWRMKVMVDGITVAWEGASTAEKYGFAFIWDESSLIRKLSVAENLCMLGRIPLWTPYVKSHVYESQARELLEYYGLQEIDPAGQVSDLTRVQCFLLEIVRCVMNGARFLFLDCMPAFQHTAELIQLEKLLKQLAEQGKTIVLLTNRADERLFFAQRFVIMRNGRRVKTLNRKEVSAKELRDYGESVHAGDGPDTVKRLPAEEKIVAAARQLQVLDRACDFAAYRGKVTGIFCPDERYARRLAQTMEKGKIQALSFRFLNHEYAGAVLPWRVRKKICVVKSLAANQTILPNFSALDNIWISSSGLAGIVPRLRKDIRRLIEQEESGLLLKMDEAIKEYREEPLLNLKIVAKRALLMQCSMILLECPMQGLDETNCRELAVILRGLTDQGMAVVLLECRKSYLPEYCDVVSELDALVKRG